VIRHTVQTHGSNLNTKLKEEKMKASRKTLIALMMITILSLTMLQAQTRWVQHGTAMYNSNPIKDVQIQLWISPVGSNLFIPTQPQSTTKSDDQGEWILSIDYTMQPHALFDEIKAIGKYKRCPHQTITREITVPYGIVNQMDLQFGPGSGIAYDCAICPTIQPPLTSQ